MNILSSVRFEQWWRKAAQWFVEEFKVVLDKIDTIHIEIPEDIAKAGEYDTQLSEIAKQVGDVKDLLTLADGEVTAELQTLIPNEEETV